MKGWNEGQYERVIRICTALGLLESRFRPDAVKIRLRGAKALLDEPTPLGERSLLQVRYQLYCETDRQVILTLRQVLWKHKRQ